MSNYAPGDAGYRQLPEGYELALREAGVLGIGLTHFFIGNQLARSEAAAAFRALGRRVPDIELATALSVRLGPDRGPTA